VDSRLFARPARVLHVFDLPPGAARQRYSRHNRPAVHNNPRVDGRRRATEGLCAGPFSRNDFSLVMFPAQALLAAEVAGVKLPDSIKVGDADLALNGAACARA